MSCVRCLSIPKMSRDIAASMEGAVDEATGNVVGPARTTRRTCAGILELAVVQVSRQDVGSWRDSDLLARVSPPVGQFLKQQGASAILPLAFEPRRS